MTELDVFQQRPAIHAAQFTPARAAPAMTPATDIDSWTLIVSDVIKLANIICETQFVPKAYRDNGPATAAAILAGRELGLPPMTSLRHVQVVEGSPSLSAEYKRARVLAAGHELDILELTITRCRVSGRRRNSGKPPLEITFTIEDAKRAGIFKARGAWETRPRRMLFARAGTEVCDFLFADVTNGLPTAELLEAGDVDEFGGYAESPAQAAPAAAAPASAPPTARRRQPAEPRPDPATAGGAAPAATAAAAPATGRPAPAADGLPPLPGENETETHEAGGGDTTAAPDDRSPALASSGQVGIIASHFRRLGFAEDERDQRLAVTATIASREPIGSTKELTQLQAKAVADTLSRCRDRDRLIALLAAGEKPDAAGSEAGE